jgi:hypothetical protein
LGEQVSEDPSGDPVSRDHVVANHNRWSRSVFNFKDLVGNTWCELNFLLTWHPDEENRHVTDFAAVGIDFLTEDGSSIDFTYVPGLTRTQFDPHSCYIAGPDYHTQDSKLTRSSRVQCTFLVPAPAKQLSISIRSWRNSHPFTVHDPRLHQVSQSTSSHEEDAEQTNADPNVLRGAWITSRRSWHSLNHKPVWLSYATVPDHPLFIRGQLINESMASDGALVQVVFRNAHGEQLPPPYSGIPVSPDIGSFIEIPAHRQTRRFTLELLPPAQAATVDLGFQVKRDGSTMELVTPLEISLGEDLLLESISGQASPDALGFLAEALKRLTPDPNARHSADSGALDLLTSHKDLPTSLTIQDKLRAVQQGETTTFSSGQLSLLDFPAWPLPDVPDWNEDPFQSPTWRLEYHSLSWLLDLAKSHESGSLRRAMNLGASWSEANPWDGQRDPLSAYPLSTAFRAEVFVHLLALDMQAKKPASSKNRQILVAEIVRHAFALAEIVSQNLFPHSILHIRAACALLTLSRAISRFPLAAYWRSLALAHLRSGFDLLLGSDGSSIEQSQHYRLELISLGLILNQSLESVPEAEDFRDELTALLKENLRIVVAVTDPAGMLPPFGDIPRGHHHASWMRRLISGYGRSLLLDHNLAEELSYPTGSRAFISETAGMAAFRDYRRKPNWNYLCASFGEKRHENGHHDCASFVYSSGGVRWITDPGGSSFHDTGPARHFLISSSAHNVAMPDGREQTSGIGWVEANLTLENATVLQIGTNVYGPGYTHSRIFICLADLRAVAVFDRFTTTQRPITCEGLLHFERDVAVAIVDATQAISFRGQRRLRILPYLIEGKIGGMSVENGRNEHVGALQGFVSSPTDGFKPANVLHYRFSGSSSVCGGVILTEDQQSLRSMSELLASSGLKRLLWSRSDS